MSLATHRGIRWSAPLLLFATTAAAQGEPPFGTGNRGEVFQVSEVELSINQTTPSGCCTIEIRYAMMRASVSLARLGFVPPASIRS